MFKFITLVAVSFLFLFVFPTRAEITYDQSSTAVFTHVTGLSQKKRELQQAGLPEELIVKLVPYLDDSQKDVIAFLKSILKTGLPGLNGEEIALIQECVFLETGRRAIQLWDEMVEKERSRYPNAPYLHELNSDQQTLLFSRYYQTGRFDSHPAFLKAVLENDWKKAILALQEEAGAYLANPKMEWMGRRLLEETNWYNEPEPACYRPQS